LTVIEPKWFGDTRCWCDRDCSRSLWLLCSFQGSPEAYACRWWRPNAACATGTRLAPVSQSSTACRFVGSTPQEERGGQRRPVRFGRRARPDGRSNGPEWAAGSAGAPYGAP
jgi:hypothetical protein